MGIKQKKIILIGPAYPYRGGQALVEAYLHQLISKMGYDTETVSYTLLYPSLLFPGTTQFDKSSFIPFEHQSKIHRLINSINPLSWIKTYRYIKNAQPDAVIFVWWMPFFGPALGYIASKIRKQLNTKVIFLVENYISHEGRWFDAYFTRKTLKYANSFISESKYITEQLNKNFSQKEVVQTTLSVYSCYDLKHYSKATAKEKLNIKTPNTILFFGMIRPYKGLDKLLETFASMDHQQNTLLIAGESYEPIAKYEKLIKDYNLKDQIILHTQFIDNEDIELYFKAADVVVLPYYSGTQSGILMMAYGFNLPVVVTEVGGISELVLEGKTGIVAKNNEVENLKPAIEKILQSKSTVPYAEEIKALTHSLGYGSLEKYFKENL